MTRGGEWLNEEKLFEGVVSKAQTAAVWDRASERFAGEASGTVVGFVHGARPDRTFARIEWPTLLQNPSRRQRHHAVHRTGGLMLFRQTGPTSVQHLTGGYGVRIAGRWALEYQDGPLKARVGAELDGSPTIIWTRSLTIVEPTERAPHPDEAAKILDRIVRGMRALGEQVETTDVEFPRPPG